MNLPPELFLVAMFVLMYFLLIRPQQKRAKDHKKLLSELKKRWTRLLPMEVL